MTRGADSGETERYSEGSRTAFQAEGEHCRRSDAGVLIVREVFGFVKRNDPERSGGEAAQAEKGARERDGSPVPRSAV